MGNTSKKLASKCDLLTKEEQKCVGAIFKTASKNSNKIRDEDFAVSGKLDAELLEKLWSSQIDARLAKYLSNFLFGFGPNASQTVDFNRFAELYVCNVRGTPDERQKMLNSYLEIANDLELLPYQLLKEYCESITSTCIKMAKSSSEREVKVWIHKGFRGKPAHVQALAEFIASSVSSDPDNPANSISAKDLSSWLHTNVLLQLMAEQIFTTLYNVKRDDDSDDKHEHETNTYRLLPSATGIESMPDYPAFIDISHVIWLNSLLPKKHQHKWRFLFSSHIHGESFSTMAGRIQDQGASLLIIEENNGNIFGGYAPAPWCLGPNFMGDESSFLFSLAPKMRVYPGTAFNNHYQYLNHHTKTLPNGLMMGGQFDFGAIWITADPFGEGTSAESCTTYRGFKRLSKEGTFHIKSLEVWGVGDKPLSVKESDERESVLDVNPEAKAILELAGRTRHSEGLREPAPL